MQRNFGDVKEEIRRVAGVSGLKVGDDRLLSVVNIVQERLVTLGDWPQLKDRIKFVQYGGIVALPAEYGTLLKASIDRNDVPLFDPWYEFVASGPGQLDTTGAAGTPTAVDRGESPVFRQPVEPDVTLRLYAHADERVDGENPKARIYGLDQYGRTVRTGDEDGVEMEIVGHGPTNYTETTQTFSRIDRIVLPVRKGQVDLFYVDSNDELFLAGRYRHWETNPTFRTYWFPQLQGDGQAIVHALVRRRSVPIRKDSDPLLISNLSALRYGVKAVAKEDADRIQEAAAYWSLAQGVLAEEAKAYKSGTTPVIDCARIIGFGDIPGVMV